MQKKKILRFARPFLLVLLAIVCPISFLVRNTKNYGICNLIPSKVEGNKKKILFHVFGLRNMTRVEKKEIINDSEELKKCLGAKLDSLIDEILPDQEIIYGVDSAFICSLHIANGNPEIHIGFLSCIDYKSYFQDDAHHLEKNGIFLSPFDSKGKLKGVRVNAYFSEISHAKQFHEEPFRYTYKCISWDIRASALKKKVKIPQAFTDSLKFKTPELADSLNRKIQAFIESYVDGLQYTTAGTIEDEAHHVIQPQLEKFYQDYRLTYFRGIIKNTEERLKQAEDDLNEQGAKETLQYEAGVERKKRERDLWLYGTLYDP